MLMTPMPGGARLARRPAAVALLVSGLLLSVGAHAGLGEPVASVQRDHAALQGVTLAVTPMGAYDMHETSLADGTRVRQYVGPAGTVFGVAWTGRSLPDLKLLLAAHYARYVAAARTHHGSHHVLSLDTPDVAISVVRLPRGFAGSAHVPALVPAGISVQDLR